MHRRARHRGGPWSSSWTGCASCSSVEVADVTADVGRGVGTGRRRVTAHRPRVGPARCRGASVFVAARRSSRVPAPSADLAGLWAHEALRIAAAAAAARLRDRPPHDPARGRLARPRGAPEQGLLPRPGDRRPRAQPRPPAAPPGLPAPRRQRLGRCPRTATRVDRRTGGQVGFVGSAARHYELGPIALAIIKRRHPRRRDAARRRRPRRAADAVLRCRLTAYLLDRATARASLSFIAGDREIADFAARAFGWPPDTNPRGL